MKAVGSYVTIKPLAVDNKTNTGLLLNDDKSLRFRKAEVILCSNDSCKKGDIIFYDSFKGHKVKIEDNEYKIIQAIDVAIIL